MFCDWILKCCCVSLVSSLARSQLAPGDEAKIDEFMEELMACREMPGTAIALVKEGEIALTKGYGYANLEAQAPVTEDTIFMIASVSKSFAATLLTKFFSDVQNNLDWNSIASYASDELLHLYEGYLTNNTAFRDLMSHQTGIPRYDAVWALYPFDTRKEVVERIRFHQPVYPFRSDYRYNNNMFTFATYAVEEILASDFEEMLTQELLQPIGMDSTTFLHLVDEDYEGFATPYYWDLWDGNPDDLVALPIDTWSGAFLAQPAAGVCTNVKDMGKWLKFITNGGQNENGTAVVDPDALTRLWYPETAVNDASDYFHKPFEPVTFSYGGYGLGYFTGHYRGYRVSTHGGDLTGYHSQVFVMPDMDMASFFTTNFGGTIYERDYVNMFLADIALGVEPAYNASQVCQILEQVEAQQEAEDEHLSLEEILTTKVYDHVSSEDTKALYDANFKGIPKYKAVKTSHAIKYLKENAAKITPEVQRENYTGVYGNFALGNITVSLSEECETCLLLEYGQRGIYTLYPYEEQEHMFMGINEYVIFYSTPVIFSEPDEDGLFRFARAPYLEPTREPPFERGLQYSDAPEPDLGTC